MGLPGMTALSREGIEAARCRPASRLAAAQGRGRAATDDAATRAGGGGGAPLRDRAVAFRYPPLTVHSPNPQGATSYSHGAMLPSTAIVLAIYAILFVCLFPLWGTIK